MGLPIGILGYKLILVYYNEKQFFKGGKGRVGWLRKMERQEKIDEDWDTVLPSESRIHSGPLHITGAESVYIPFPYIHFNTLSRIQFKKHGFESIWIQSPNFRSVLTRRKLVYYIAD